MTVGCQMPCVTTWEMLWSRSLKLGSEGQRRAAGSRIETRPDLASPSTISNSFQPSTTQNATSLPRRLVDGRCSVLLDRYDIELVFEDSTKRQ